MRLETGALAPDFTLADDRGVLRSLADYRGSRMILYAYPAAMTPGCTTQACDFRDALDSLSAAGIVVLGISPDTAAALAAFRKRDGLKPHGVKMTRFPKHSDTVRLQGAGGGT